MPVHHVGLDGAQAEELLVFHLRTAQRVPKPSTRAGSRRNRVNTMVNLRRTVNSNVPWVWSRESVLSKQHISAAVSRECGKRVRGNHHERSLRPTQCRTEEDEIAGPAEEDDPDHKARTE